MPFNWKLDFNLLIYFITRLGKNREINTCTLIQKFLQSFWGPEGSGSTELLLFQTSKSIPHAVKSKEIMSVKCHLLNIHVFCKKKSVLSYILSAVTPTERNCLFPQINTGIKGIISQRGKIN